MSDSIWKCPRCGKSGEYYSTDKTICPVTKKCVCQECGDKAEAKLREFNHFGGSTYEPARDRERLSKQQLAVNAVMSDGQWHKSVDVAKAIGAKPESYAAVTSRIRDIRKICKSEEAVERRHLGGGLWEFRVPERFRAHIEVAA